MTFRLFCLSCFIIGLVAPLPLLAQPFAETPASLAAHWQNLLDADAEKAYVSMLALARTPKETLAFLRETVKPAVGVDVKVIEDLIRQLGSDRFAVREKAAQELERLDRLTLPALKKASQESTELEPKRRITALIARLEGRLSGPPLRWRRAVEVVEWIGTPEAKALLEYWGRGAADARLTHEVRRSLERWTSSPESAVATGIGPRVDGSGDLLPAGAVLRLGSTRWRAGGPSMGGSGVLYTADGKRLIVFDWQSINMVDVRDGKTLFRYEFTGLISNAFLTPDGKHLIATVYDHSNQVERNVLWIWETKELKRIRHMDAGNDDNYVVGLAENGAIALLIPFNGDVVREFDVALGKEIRRHRTPADFRLRALSGKLAVALHSKGKQLIVYEWANPKKTISLDVKEGSSIGSAPDISPDGKIVAWVGEKENQVTLFDRLTGREIFRLVPKGPAPKYFSHVLFSPDGKTLTTHTFKDKWMVTAWDMDDHKVRWETESIHGRMAFSPDSRFLAARSDTRIFILDAATGKEVTDTTNWASAEAPYLEFSSDGRGLWHSQRDALCLWDFPSGHLRATLPHAKISGAAISPDGRSAATLSAGADACIWDVATAKKRLELANSAPRPSGLAFARDGKGVVTWGNDFVLRNWDANDGHLIAEHRPRPKEFPEQKEDNDNSREKRLDRDRKIGDLQGKLNFDTAVSADGSRLFWYFKKFWNYDATSGKDLGAFDGIANSSAFNSQRAKTSDDGEWLLVGGPGRVVTLFNLPLGVMLGELSFDRPQLNRELAMSPDGLCFAVATMFRPNTKIFIYETATLQRRLTISQEHGGITRLAFSPRNRFLAAAQSDGTVLVYDLRQYP